MESIRNGKHRKVYQQQIPNSDRRLDGWKGKLVWVMNLRHSHHKVEKTIHEQVVPVVEFSPFDNEISFLLLLLLLLLFRVPAIIINIILYALLNMWCHQKAPKKVQVDYLTHKEIEKIMCARQKTG